jgi:hypothetical protein
MFKSIFFNGVVSSIFGAVISVVYILIFKYSPLEADFTEQASFVYLLSFNLIIGMSACFLYFILLKILTKEHLSSFVVGFILSGISISIALKMMFTVNSELTFKNENAEMFKDFYYFILAPIPFFPVLSWLTFKPLIIKQK